MRVTSGIATLSGTWNGAAVHWTGHVDLTSNPLATRPIAGWPAGAFATELRQAAFFAPLGNALARSIVRAPIPVGAPPSATVGSQGVHHMDSAGGVLGRAGAWCVGGAIGGASAVPESGPLGPILGCAGGAVGSLLGDLVSYLDDDGPM